jgi:thioredoxin 1
MKLLKFHALWCGPCQGLSMLINNMEDEIKIHVENVDIDSDNETAIKYGVRSVPTLILVDDSGVEIKRHSGSLTKDDLLKFLGE